MFFIYSFEFWVSFLALVLQCFMHKHCLQISGLRMCRVTWNQFLIKNFDIWFDCITFVGTRYLSLIWESLNQIVHFNHMKTQWLGSVYRWWAWLHPFDDRQLINPLIARTNILKTTKAWFLSCTFSRSVEKLNMQTPHLDAWTNLKCWKTASQTLLLRDNWKVTEETFKRNVWSCSSTD